MPVSCSTGELHFIIIRNNTGKCLQRRAEVIAHDSQVSAMTKKNPNYFFCVSRFHGKIETVRQFYAAQLHWGAPHPVWAMSLEHAQVPHLQALFQRFETHDDRYLHNRSMAGGYGVAIERLHAGSYSFGDYVQLDSLQEQDVSDC